MHSIQSPRPCCRRGAAPNNGDANGKASIPRAIAATPAETARGLRDLRRDQIMTQRSLNLIQAGGPGAYERALHAA